MLYAEVTEPVAKPPRFHTFRNLILVLRPPSGEHVGHLYRPRSRFLHQKDYAMESMKRKLAGAMAARL